MRGVTATRPILGRPDGLPAVAEGDDQQHDGHDRGEHDDDEVGGQGDRGPAGRWAAGRSSSAPASTTARPSTEPSRQPTELASAPVISVLSETPSCSATRASSACSDWGMRTSRRPECVLCCWGWVFLDLAGGHLLARVRLVPFLDNGGTHPVNGPPDEARDLGLREADLARDVDLAAVLVVAHLQDALLALGEHAHAGLQQRALVGEVVGGGGGVLGLELDRRRP